MGPAPPTVRSPQACPATVRNTVVVSAHSDQPGRGQINPPIRGCEEDRVVLRGYSGSGRIERVQGRRLQKEASMRWRMAVVGALTVLSLSPGTVLAQTGTIKGRVTDGYGRPLRQVTVTAQTPSIPQPLNYSTDAEGNYSFRNLPLGEYELTFEPPGMDEIPSSAWPRRSVQLSADALEKQVDQLLEIACLIDCDTQAFCAFSTVLPMHMALTSSSANRTETAEEPVTGNLVHSRRPSRTGDTDCPARTVTCSPSLSAIVSPCVPTESPIAPESRNTLVDTSRQPANLKPAVCIGHDVHQTSPPPCCLNAHS